MVIRAANSERARERCRRPADEVRRGRLIAFGIAIAVLPPAASAGKLGPLKWEETLSASLEYNSNITTSEENPVADWTAQARFSISGSWEVTRYVIFNYGFGVGYRRHLGESGFDQRQTAAIRLVPDTTIDFVVRASDQLEVRVANSINFLENASDIVAIDPETGAVVTDLFSFERIRNRASVDAEWSVNQRNQLALGFSRSDVIPLSARFDDFRRTQHMLNGRWTRGFSASIRGGLTGSLYDTTYKTNLNNDSDGRSWGPFLEWGLTNNLTLMGDVQFVRTGFERRDQLPGVEDDFDYHATEWGVGLTHAFNARMSYTLEYRVSSDYGYISNYRALRIARGALGWQATRTGQADFSVAYEWGDDSGGMAPDHWERLFLSVGYTQPFWEDFEYSVRVRWTDKVSQVSGRSYEQFTAYIGLVYHFPAR